MKDDGEIELEAGDGRCWSAGVLAKSVHWGSLPPSCSGHEPGETGFQATSNHGISAGFVPICPLFVCLDSGLGSSVTVVNQDSLFLFANLVPDPELVPRSGLGTVCLSHLGKHLRWGAGSRKGGWSRLLISWTSSHNCLCAAAPPNKQA